MRTLRMARLASMVARLPSCMKLSSSERRRAPVRPVSVEEDQGGDGVGAHAIAVQRLMALS